MCYTALYHVLQCIVSRATLYRITLHCIVSRATLHRITCYTLWCVCGVCGGEWGGWGCCCVAVWSFTSKVELWCSVAFTPVSIGLPSMYKARRPSFTTQYSPSLFSLIVAWRRRRRLEWNEVYSKDTHFRWKIKLELEEL